jgi:hypothetical protein
LPELGQVDEEEGEGVQRKLVNIGEVHYLSHEEDSYKNLL